MMSVIQGEQAETRSAISDLSAGQTVLTDMVQIKDLLGRMDSRISNIEERWTIPASTGTGVSGDNTIEAALRKALEADQKLAAEKAEPSECDWQLILL
jgi:hypothetical protein